VLFGYATAIDGDRKAKRKEQWEEAIAEKKSEIEKLEQAMVERTKRVLTTRFGTSDRGNDSALKKSVSGIWDAEINVDPETAQEETTIAAQKREQTTGDRLGRFIEYPVGHHSYPNPPSIPYLDPTKNHCLPPQSLWSKKVIRVLDNQMWTNKKTYNVELCMARLVLELCIASGLSELQGEHLESLPLPIRPYAALSKDEAKSLARQLELELITLHSFTGEVDPVRRGFLVPIPQYRNDYSERTEVFNSRLAGVLGSRKFLNSDTVATICADIMASIGRPDTQSVNHLLVAFTRFERHDLMKSTVSTIYDGHFRPNELTCATILRFYRQQKDEKRFMEYISLMRGKRGGLMLAKPHFKTFLHPEASRGRCIPAGSRIIQAVTPSPLTYLEMIMGLAQLVGIEKTWAFCNNLASYGWGLDFSCIYMLLFKSAVESATGLSQVLWAEAERLASFGHHLPKQLYALMIAIHKLENDKDRSWELFEDCLSQHPEQEFHILELVHERMKLIKRTRIAEKDVQQQTIDHLEEAFNQTIVTSEAETGPAIAQQETFDQHEEFNETIITANVAVVP